MKPGCDRSSCGRLVPGRGDWEAKKRVKNCIVIIDNNWWQSMTIDVNRCQSMTIDDNRCQSMPIDKVTEIFFIDWSSIININQLIDIDCHRLISILIDHRFHRLVTLGLVRGTVEPCLMSIPLIQPSCYHGNFILVWKKLWNPFDTATLWIQPTFCGLLMRSMGLFVVAYTEKFKWHMHHEYNQVFITRRLGWSLSFRL